jgi:hypothetical protein
MQLIFIQFKFNINEHEYEFIYISEKKSNESDIFRE